MRNQSVDCFIILWSYLRSPPATNPTLLARNNVNSQIEHGESISIISTRELQMVPCLLLFSKVSNHLDPNQSFVEHIWDPFDTYVRLYRVYCSVFGVEMCIPPPTVIPHYNEPLISVLLPLKSGPNGYFLIFFWPQTLRGGRIGAQISSSPIIESFSLLVRYLTFVFFCLFCSRQICIL